MKDKIYNRIKNGHKMKKEKLIKNINDNLFLKTKRRNELERDITNLMNLREKIIKLKKENISEKLLLEIVVKRMARIYDEEFSELIKE